MNFKNRDFLEKRIFFKHNGAYYIYLTFIPDEVSKGIQLIIHRYNHPQKMLLELGQYQVVLR